MIYKELKMYNAAFTLISFSILYQAGTVLKELAG